MVDLPAAYRSVASRQWPHDRLASHDLAARQRGISDLPEGRVAPTDHPIVFVAAAMPRLTNLAVAAHLLHVLPPSEPRRDAGDELLQAVDAASAGSLHRVHLALAAVGDRQSDDPEGWEPLIYDETAQLLHGLKSMAAPLIAYSEHAGQLAANAIEALDLDHPSVQETLADCLARLLAICVLVDVAVERPPNTT
jgi:hypothetical protein